MTAIALGAVMLGGAYLGLAALPIVLLLGVVGRWLGTVSVAMVALMMACTLFGAWRTAGSDDGPPPLPAALGGAARIEGVAVSRAADSGTAQRFVVDTGGVQLCATAPVLPEVRRGDRVAIVGGVTPLAEVAPAYQTTVRLRNCSGTIDGSQLVLLEEGGGLAHAMDRLAGAIARSAQRIAPGDQGALLAGLVTGDDAALSSARREDFYTTGTSHITAVSGGNLALIVGVAGGLAGRRSRRRGWGQAIVIIGVVWLYAMLAGGAPPVIRAAMVASLAVCARPLGRRADLMTLAFLVAAVEAIVTPAVIHTLSFQLSTTAALALVFVLGEQPVRDRRHVVAGLGQASLAAQWATLPVLAASVGMPSPWSIPANVLVVAVVALVYPMAMASAAIGLVSPAAANVAGIVPAAGAGVILRSVEMFAGLPGSTQITLAGDRVGIAMLSLVAVVGVAAASAEVRGGAQRVLRDAVLVRGEAGWIVLSLAAGLATGMAVLAAAR